MSTETRITKLECELAIVQKLLVGVQECVTRLSSRALLGDELKKLNDEAKGLREGTQHAERCPCRCDHTPIAIIDQNWRWKVFGRIGEMLHKSEYDGTGANSHAVRQEFNINDLPTDPSEWEPMLQKAFDRAINKGALSKY